MLWHYNRLPAKGSDIVTLVFAFFVFPLHVSQLSSAVRSFFFVGNFKANLYKFKTLRKITKL